MDIEFTYLLAALGAGAFGAAVGGQPSFILTGFAALVGIGVALAGGEYNFLGNVAFGAFFGPHIAFGGAVAACAYAARRGVFSSGRDIATPIAGTAAPDALVVGALFGAGGYLFNQFLVWALEKDPGVFWTDTIALTVFVSAVVVRLMFGRTGLFGSPTDEHLDSGSRLSLSADAVWVGHQGAWPMTTILGIATGLLTAWAITTMAAVDMKLASAAVTIGWAFSAVSLLLLQFGQPGPVTHHMTLPAAVAAVTVLGAGGSPELAVILGAVAGTGGALLGELTARVFLIHGDTHIDPPAIAIFMMNTIILVANIIF